MTRATVMADTARTPPTVRSFEMEFAPEAARVSQMRRITAAHLRLWGVSGSVAADILIAVSELVSNGILHGWGDVTLRVRRTGEEVRVEVVDGNPAPATLRNVDADSPSGRGLFLVAVLALDWGVSPDGMTTWCRFRLPAGRS